MSLRARLIIGLLVIAAVGLITLAAITYAEQRSFLIQRVDQEAENGWNFISRRLDCLGVNVIPTGQQQGCAPGPFGGGFAGPEQTLPPGTFGYRRDANGNLVGRPVEETYQFANGTYKQFPAPDLPTHIPPEHPITVGSSSGTNFRVLSEPTQDQPGTTIIAIPLADVEQTLHRLFVIEALVVGAVLAALAAISWWLVKLGLRPLDRIATTAGAIAEGDLSQRVTPATEKTEVGRLGLALNAMLSQIERAFKARQASEDRLRQFLADASHELRTPLASIRGYAELYRLGAAHDPERVASSMRRIESEATRMGQLVENLLTLARLDQLPEVARKRVDLAELVSEAVEDARVAAPERQIELEVDGAVAVLGDPLQLKQVVLNLLGNALVHTPPATEIDVKVTSDTAVAVVEVRDHGDGLPTEDTDALFERFWRAEPGRGRGAAGAGLGLAIVKAIIEGHRGRVQAANAADGGAVFTVRLPREPSAASRLPSAAAREPSAAAREPSAAARPSAPLAGGPSTPRH
jgi:two-component system OmpR family sensor kinase